MSADDVKLLLVAVVVLGCIVMGTGSGGFGVGLWGGLGAALVCLFGEAPGEAAGRRGRVRWLDPAAAHAPGGVPCCGVHPLGSGGCREGPDPLLRRERGPSEIEKMVVAQTRLLVHLADRTADR